MQRLFDPSSQEVLYHKEEQQQGAKEQFLEEVCQICYFSYSKYNHEPLRPALICYDCWYEHVRTNITKISYMVGADIISPFEGNANIEVVMALNGLRSEHRRQLEEMLFRKYSTFTPDIEKCPSESCDYVYTAENCNWGMKKLQKCPKCQVLFRASQSLSLGSLLGLIYFLFLTKKCPKCSIPIEKTSGCPHMTCPCGHQFCWFCLKDHMARTENLYSAHEPKECAFIFLSKLLMVFICLVSLSSFLVGGETIRYLIEGLFNLLGYLVQAIFVDLYLAGMFLVVKVYNSQPYRNLPFQSCSRSVQLFLLLGVQMVVVLGLYAMEFLGSIVEVLLMEIKLAGCLGGLLFLVLRYNRNWFEFIV